MLLLHSEARWIVAAHWPLISGEFDDLHLWTPETASCFGAPKHPIRLPAEVATRLREIAIQHATLTKTRLQSNCLLYVNLAEIIA